MSVRILVTDPAGAPAAGVHVSALATWVSATTLADGVAVLEGLIPEDTYHLSAEQISDGIVLGEAGVVGWVPHDTAVRLRARPARVPRRRARSGAATGINEAELAAGGLYQSSTIAMCVLGQKPADHLDRFRS